MAESTPPNTANGLRARGSGRRWRPGESGNPQGRPHGSKNQQAVWAMLERAGGCSPLEFFLLLMNDTARPMALRMKAASAAAPYLHRPLAQTTDAPDLHEPPPPLPVTDRQRRRDAALNASMEDIADRMAGLI